MKIHVIHDLCTGCHTCQIVCALVHFKVNNPKKAALKIEARFPDPGAYCVHVCIQCGQCAEVCPEEAFRRDGNRYLLDPEKCTFCQACVEACPKGVLTMHQQLSVPIKCDYCFECVEICAYNALSLRE